MKIVESNPEIRKRILTALLEEVRDSFNKSIPTLKNKIGDLIRDAITSEPEYQSLVSGKLRAELGVADAEDKVRTLLEIWKNNIDVEIKPFRITNLGLSGGLSINCIKSDFSDVLGSSAANMEDTVRGYSLPWLSWLLLEGGKILVKDHSLVVGSSSFSRTGEAIMRASTNGTWRVPPEFAGTETNNWITRAIDRLDNEIYRIIQETIESNVP